MYMCVPWCVCENMRYMCIEMSSACMYNVAMHVCGGVSVRVCVSVSAFRWAEGHGNEA